MEKLYLMNYSTLVSTGFVGFETSSLVVDSVDSITLTLIHAGGNTVDCSLNIYEITEDWGDWSETTLNNGTSPSAGDTPIAPAVNATGNAIWNLPTDTWQSGKNLGFAVAIATSDVGATRDFVTVEYPHDTNDSLAPQLEITYSDSEPVPEPGTLALLGIGLPALIAWKRRRED